MSTTPRERPEWSPIIFVGNQFSGKTTLFQSLTSSDVNYEIFLLVFRPPNGTFQYSRLHDRIFRFFVHLLPAYAVDAILYVLLALNVTKHKPFLVRLIGKMHNGMAALEWFANRQWVWANENVVALEKELNATDRDMRTPTSLCPFGLSPH